MNWDYLAGFLDGEGSIIIRSPRVRLYISNTDKNILDEIQKFLNCGAVYHVKRNDKPKWKKQYGWTVGNHKDCLRILRELNFRLILKKDLCEKAINYIENKRWHGEYLSKEELEKLKHLPYRKIAKEIGVSHMVVFKYLRKYGIK